MKRKYQRNKNREKEYKNNNYFNTNTIYFL